MNIKLHRFDWDREEQIVKQSASSALGGFAGFFLSAVLCAATVITQSRYSVVLNIAVVALLSCLTLLLYRKNNKTELASL